jgi:hypothetical protein
MDASRKSTTARALLIEKGPIDEKIVIYAVRCIKLRFGIRHFSAAGQMAASEISIAENTINEDL